MISRDSVEQRLEEADLAFLAIPDGWAVDLLSGHDPVIVTIDDDADGGPRMLLTTEVFCDLISELDLAALSESLADQDLSVGRSENDEKRIWIRAEFKDSVPEAHALALLMLALQLSASGASGLLSRSRVERLLQAAVLARGVDPACQVRKDANGDWLLETEGLPIVMSGLVADVIDDEHSYRLAVFSNWPVIRQDDGTRETLAGLKSAHPGVKWEVGGGDVRMLGAHVTPDVSQVRTEEDVETALGVLQLAAVEAEQLAEALGIETWEARAQGRRDSERDRNRQDEVMARLAGLAGRIKARSSGGDEPFSRDVTELFSLDSVDPDPERGRVLLRESADEGGIRVLFATLDDAGDLRICGDDSGPAVTARFGEGVSRTEWVRRVEARDVPALLSHLGADPAEPTLEAIARLADRVESALLIDEAVPFHFDSWES